MHSPSDIDYMGTGSLTRFPLGELDEDRLRLTFLICTDLCVGRSNILVLWGDANYVK